MSRFALVAAERGDHAVATLCRIIGASVSGFDAWLRAVPSVQARAEAEAGCAATSAASSRPGGARPARRGCTPSCAARGGVPRAGAWRG